METKNNKSGFANDMYIPDIDMGVLARMAEQFPRGDSLEFIWHILRGYWKNTSGMMLNFCYKDGVPGVELSQWESTGRGFGAFTGGKQTGRNSVGINVRYPAKDADVLTGAQPATDISFNIELSAINNDLKIGADFIYQGKKIRETFWYSHRGVANLCAYFPGGFEMGRIEKRAIYYKGTLSVELLAGWLTEWSGLDFAVSANLPGSDITVDWATYGDLFVSKGNKGREGFVFNEEEMAQWFMLDSLWYSIKENFMVGDIYFTMDGGKELVVPGIGYPKVFPLDIPYLGSMFYYAHRDLKGDDELKRPVPIRMIRPSGSVNMSGMTLIRQSSIEWLPEDNNAKLSLYAQVARDKDGSFMFDDGQDWLLVLETVRGKYPLFPRKYVQLGMVNYFAYIAYEKAEEVLHVLVTTEYSANYEIYDCVYNAKIRAFRHVPVFNSGEINPIGSSSQFFER